MGHRAVVVGGGIGGLAAAIGLRRTGWEVTVVERAPVLADAGAGISLHANGLRALDALGVGAPVREAARPQYTGGTRTPAGRLLARMDGAALERELGTPIVGIPRSALHRALREALPAATLLTGEEVRAVEDAPEPEGGQVRVPLGDTVLYADLVVAADGVGSRLRRQLFPHHPGPVHSGSAVVRAITDGPVDTGTDFELTWGGGAEFGHIAFADGRAEWHAVLTAPPGVRHRDTLAAMRHRFGSWHDPIPRLLDATRPEAVLHHDIAELATPLPRFTVGRVAPLGDAA
ncbi:FAD-dependent monooxygenase, partial [Streptomyces oryzae]